jgi:hypothetical protein
MTEDLEPIPQLKQPEDIFGDAKYKIAMIIDGVVHSVLFLKDQDAARYLSEPIFVQVPRSLDVRAGDEYDGQSFIHKE